MTSLPTSASFVVVGGGVQGLSAAYHLADELAARGRTDSRIVVLERRALGAGASGLSGGIVRNFYLSPAMNELVRESVEIFELDPSGFGYRPVGYVAAVREEQLEDIESIAAQHRETGYRSELVLGPEQARRYLEGLFPDWRAPVAGVLHEHQGGYADPMAVVRTLAGMARTLGVEIHEETEVTGFDIRDGAVTKVETTRGDIACDIVVVAPGPWAAGFWELLGLPLETSAASNGASTTTPMFHYLKIQEGDFVLHEGAHLSRGGRRAPVVHYDCSSPLVSERDGRELSPGPWGVYFRTGRERGIQGGGLPVPLGHECSIDPYGPSNPDHGAPEPWFDDFFTSALGAVLGRFTGRGAEWTCSSYSAVGCFTPDSYPVADFVLDNVFAILDSTHAFKLLALGKLAARRILDGSEPRLDPFRMSRFGAGTTHPVSASPYPWT